MHTQFFQCKNLILIEWEIFILTPDLQALFIYMNLILQKDKASILMATREYLLELKSRISIIKSKNQELENHLSYSGEESTSVKMDINEKQRIEISRNIGLECSISGMQEVNGRILVRIEENWNVIDLVLHILRCLKVMGNIDLVSMNHLSATATLVVHIKV